MRFIQEMIAKKKAVHEADLDAAGIIDAEEDAPRDAPVISMEEIEPKGEPNELPDGLVTPVDPETDRPSADILHYKGQDEADSGAPDKDVPGFSLLLGDVDKPAENGVAAQATETDTLIDPDLAPPAEEPDPAPEAQQASEPEFDDDFDPGPEVETGAEAEPAPEPEPKPDVWAEAERLAAERAEEARRAEMFPEVSPQPQIADEVEDEPDLDDLGEQLAVGADAAPEGQTNRKIWDMQDPDQYAPPASSPLGKEEAAIAAATANAPDPRPAGGRRANRVKTRLLGFASAEDLGANVFDAKHNKPPTGVVMKPVGWIIVVDGPGRGGSFPLVAGVSQIGRGPDQAVRLDFGDTSISRDNHASIAFDEEQQKFFIGHGGKSNLVRLNNKPVLSTEEMTHHDMIRIGETTLRFIALCGPDFSWDTPEGDNVDHAASS